MYYHNLIEDDSQAQDEQTQTKVAVALIVFGLLWVALNYDKN